jgi:hypothetical protein
LAGRIVEFDGQRPRGAQFKVARAKHPLHGWSRREAGEFARISRLFRRFAFRKSVERAAGDAQCKTRMFIGNEARMPNLINRAAPILNAVE